VKDFLLISLKVNIKKVKGDVIILETGTGESSTHEAMMMMMNKES
jgi:hypothetical protein